jgi:hypothetical protein
MNLKMEKDCSIAGAHGKRAAQVMNHASRILG